LSGFSVSIVQADLLRLVGYKTEQEPDDKLRALIAEATTEAEKLARPQAMLGLFEEKDVPAGTHLSAFFSSALDAGAAGGRPAGAAVSRGAFGPPALQVAISVCTIGPLLEERVSEYSSAGELTRGLILDAAGSVLAEAVCDYANEKICADAGGRSLYTTCRVSPGYGRWKIEEQKVIFDLLPADSIGVILTKSFMMIPRKSVSFAVRLTRERPTGQPGSPCALCGREDCEFRR
jgi:hypothetical protein